MISLNHNISFIDTHNISFSCICILYCSLRCMPVKVYSVFLFMKTASQQYKIYQKYVL